ncbi:MAG: stalk domain-containing protein [Caldisericia bacterium]
MLKKIVKLVLSIIVISSFIHIPKLAVAQNEIPRFICMSYSDKSKILLSWEKVAFADSYEVLKNNKKIFEATDKTTELIDGNTSPGMNYSYQIVAKKGEEILGLSIRTSAFIEEKRKTKSLSLEFKLDDYMYKINGQMEGPMDTPPIIKNGRSFLVIRYITEAVGAELSWDRTEKSHHRGS